MCKERAAPPMVLHGLYCIAELQLLKCTAGRALGFQHQLHDTKGGSCTRQQGATA